VHQASKIVTLFALAICVLLATLPANAGQNPHFTVFVYDDARVSDDILARAERRATLTFARAGFDLNWVNCPRGNTDHTLSLCNGTGGQGILFCASSLMSQAPPATRPSAWPSSAPTELADIATCSGKEWRRSMRATTLTLQEFSEA